MSVSLDGTGDLSVNGTAYGDQVIFNAVSSLLTVVDGGQSTSFPLSQVKTIEVQLADGPDSVSFGNAITIPVLITAGTGADSISGDKGSSTLVGGSGNDTLVGVGTATQYEFLPQAAPASYTLDQTVPGQNVFNFIGLPAGDDLTVNLSADTLAVYDNVTVHDAAPGQGANINEVFDGKGNDTLTGSANATTIIGGNGSDLLIGGPGADLIHAGNGDTTIFGEGGADSLYGGPGEDLIFALNNSVDPGTSSSPVVPPVSPDGPGAFLLAGSGDTSIVGGPGPDTLLAGSGNDTIHGMAGDGYIGGGSGNDVLFGDTGTVTIAAGTGNTTIAAGTGEDTVYGGTGSSSTTFIDSNLPDEKSTAAEGALINAAALTANATSAAHGTTAPTYLELGTPGAPGNIVLASGPNTTTIGGAGNDTLQAGQSGEVIAGTGDDLLIGGTGSSTLQGGEGSDTIAAGSGPDLLIGGDGDSTFLNLNGYSDTIVGGTGQNIVEAPPGGSTNVSNVQVTYVPLNPSQALVSLGVSGTYTAPKTGTLNLLFNDTRGGFADNTGAFTVNFNGTTYVVEGTNAAGVPVQVVKGVTYRYSATGIINNGTGDLFGPAGNKSHDSVSPYTPDPLAPYGSLAGLFVVAASPSTPASAAIVPPVQTATPLTSSSTTIATVSGGVLHASSTFTNATVGIQISEANNIITVVDSAIGTETFSAVGISLVSVLGGGGNDSFNFNTLLVPLTLKTGNGNNYVVGGTLNETLTGGNGNDTIIGSGGRNVISGGGGDNVLYGGTGDDSIIGGSGSDWIYPGGFGVSLFDDPESDTIVGGSGTEKIDLAGDADPEAIRMDLGTITDEITGAVTHISKVRNLWAGAGNDLIVGPTSGGALICAGSGNDTMYGISASDIIYGGAGDDQAFLDGHQGYLDLIGNHSSTPGNTDIYNAGNTIIPASLDATDFQVALAKAP